MLINAANLDALFISFSKQFADAYMTEPAPLTDQVGTRIPSNTRDQRYPIVQSISGAMRQWGGTGSTGGAERQAQNIALDGFTVTNLKWENSLTIERTDLEDDQYGVYSSMLIPNLARHAKLLPDLQIASIFNSNPTTYDNVTFFSGSHPIDPSGQNPGTQSNTSGATHPLNATELAKAQAFLMSLKGPDAIPMGSYGDTLLVPPSLAYVAMTLANAAFFPEGKNNVSSIFGAQSNVFQGAFRVVVSPYLTDTGDPTTAVWYLLDCRSASQRPVFWQEHTAPQLVSLVDPASPTVFFEDRFYMGVRMRGAAAGALWFKAYRGNA
jgi:phage major head subunit gpT-like protein